MQIREADMNDADLQGLDAILCDDVKLYRIALNIDQATLAERAGINVRTLRNLEAGRGTTLRTFVAVLTALGRQPWLRLLIPKSVTPPKVLLQVTKQRKRVKKQKAR